MNISVDMLISEIAKSAKKSFLELFQNKENYYYCTLVTTGEAHVPFISAWSREALEREALKSPQYGNPTEAKTHLKWSYGETPYMAFKYEENFQNVINIFNELPVMDCFLDDNEWDRRYSFRLGAMEEALKQIDSEGIFALNQPRSKVYINVEVMPPDYTNTERALRLNKAEDIADWLEEAAEKM